MSLFLSTEFLIFWAIFYITLVFLVFHEEQLYSYLNHGMALPHDPSFNVRVISFSFVGLFCVLFSFILNRFRKALGGLHEIFSMFPYPLVASDIDGRIHFFNKKALKLLDIDEAKLLNSRYFDLFSPVQGVGKTVAAYLRKFEGNSTSSEIILQIGDHEVGVDTLLLETNQPTLLLTIFKPSKELLAEEPAH